MAFREWFWRSPTGMVTLTLAGAAVGALVFTLPDFVPHAGWPLLVLGLGTYIAGVLTVFLVPSRLGDEIKNERWSAAELAPWRRRTQSGAWLGAQLILLAVMVVVLVNGFLTPHHSRFRGEFFWPLFLLIQAGALLSRAFKDAQRQPIAKRTWLQ